MIYTYKKFINENIKNTLTLYHGTCNGENLIKNGWKPNTGYVGSNMGNPNYLYLSSEPQDALWFAEEKGCNIVIEIVDIPIDYLRPDPDDEAGFSMKELLDRINNSKLPSKFILTKQLNNKHFKLLI